MQHNSDHPISEQIQRLALYAVRAVPGVAQIAASDLQVQMVGGKASIDCTLSVRSGVKLYEVGAIVQSAIAAALTRGIGVEVQEVNVYINQIATHAEKHVGDSGKNVEHA